MKKNFPRVLMYMVMFMAEFSSMAQAQTTYKIIDSKDIDMKLSGTSTLHKWAMDAKTFSGEARFGFKTGSKKELASIESLDFSLEVQNLKSGEKGLDKNAYKALKTSKYKDIFYKLISATLTADDNNKYLVKTNGSLTIAGVTKEVTMDVYCLVNKDESITCNGSKKLKMTDYQVKPPTFMLGAMKTGDAITLDFVLVYKK
ncbi:MAG TPA: YceI family protein [Puia sp.]|nr:YceI family protein [Puia sp.]